MLVKVCVKDPEGVLSEGADTEWSGTYTIEVSDDLSPKEAINVAVTVCREQLGISEVDPVTVTAVEAPVRARRKAARPV